MGVGYPLPKIKKMLIGVSPVRENERNTLGVGYPLPKMRKTLIGVSPVRENESKPSL